MTTDVRLKTPKALISANPRSICRVIDRGPNWLFIRAPRGRLLGRRMMGENQLRLSEEIWQLAERHMIYRIILHLEDVEGIDATAAAEIIELQKNLNDVQGSLRLCGLRPDCGRQMFREMHCDTVHNYATPYDAVLGYPCKDQPTNFEACQSADALNSPTRKTIRKRRRLLPR